MLDFAYHPDAEADYEESYTWYLLRDVSAAERFRAAIQHGIDRIRNAPDSFPICEGDCRELILSDFPFQIVFRQEGVVIQIIAVSHGKRRRGYWRRRVNPR